MNERVLVEERPAKLLLESGGLPACLGDSPVWGLLSLSLMPSPSFFPARLGTAHMAWLSWLAKVQKKPKTAVVWYLCPDRVVTSRWAPVCGTGHEVSRWKLQEEDYDKT